MMPTIERMEYSGRIPYVVRCLKLCTDASLEPARILATFSRPICSLARRMQDRIFKATIVESPAGTSDFRGTDNSSVTAAARGTAALNRSRTTGAHRLQFPQSFTFVHSPKYR